MRKISKRELKNIFVVIDKDGHSEGSIKYFNECEIIDDEDYKNNYINLYY